MAPGSERHPARLARMAERYRSIRIFLHLLVLIRTWRNARWHLNCIWRELREFLHGK